MGKCTDCKSDVKNKIVYIHDLISTSYHEAGHTIYALLHLMKVLSVQIFPDEYNRISGFTNYEFISISDIHDQLLTKYAINSELSISYAGLISEKYYFKTISGSDKFPIILNDGSSEDFALATKIIKQYNLAPPGKQRRILKQQLTDNVLQELQIHWDVVSLVAHELYKKKKLSYSEIRSLLINKSNNKKFWRIRLKELDNFYENYQRLDDTDLRLILNKLKLL